MAKPNRYYSPCVSRFLVSVLYHEARRRKLPMTKLIDELLRQQLVGSVGWEKAQEVRVAENPGSTRWQSGTTHQPLHSLKSFAAGAGLERLKNTCSLDTIDIYPCGNLDHECFKSSQSSRHSSCFLWRRLRCNVF